MKASTMLCALVFSAPCAQGADLLTVLQGDEEFTWHGHAALANVAGDHGSIIFFADGGTSTDGILRTGFDGPPALTPNWAVRVMQASGQNVLITGDCDGEEFSAAGVNAYLVKCP